MGFPNIDIDKPVGTDYVSSVDDYERETRNWFVQCMRIISGYPNIDTIAVKSWSTANRPNIGNSSKVVLGFNSDTNELEVLKSNNNTTQVVGVAKQVILSVYPVGSYYETSDVNFDPNTAWGGTWVEDTTGRTLVSRGQKKNASNQVISGSTNFALGDIGGEEEHALTRPELPIHYHPHRHPHNHDVSGGFIQQVGSGETATGYIPSTSSSGAIQVKVNSAVESGLQDKVNKAYSMKQVNNADEGWFDVASDFSQHGMVDADTPKSGDTRTVSEDLLMHVGSTVGTNGHNNMQPYKVCIRWHRIA